MRLKSKVVKLNPPINESTMEDMLDQYLQDGWQFNQVITLGAITYIIFVRITAN